MQSAPAFSSRSSGSSSESRILPHRAKTISNASSVSSTSSNSISSAPSEIKCPELLVLGTDLQQRVALERLYKKGKRFESGWSAHYVAIYANTLFYYERVDDLPRGVVPLAGCSVTAVDRIFKNNNSSSSSSDTTTASSTGEQVAEDCGPCWKLTSSVGRVLLFRSATTDDRDAWLDRVNQANVEHPAHRRRSSTRRSSSIEAAGGIPHSSRRRRSSSSGTSASIVSRHSFDDSPQQLQQQQLPQRHVPHHQKRRSDVAASGNAPVSVPHDVSEMLRDAMQLVKQQKAEILALKSKLRDLETARDLEAAFAAATARAEGATVTIATTANGMSSRERHPHPHQHQRLRPGVDLEPDDTRNDKNETAGTIDAALVAQAHAIEMEVEEASVARSSDSVDSALDAGNAVAPRDDDGAAAAASTATMRDSDSDVDAMLGTSTTIPPAPLSAPAQLERTTAPASSSNSSSAFAGNDYLQQQAMELHEIARSLQSSFRSDFAFPQFPAADESAPSAASTFIDSFSQRNSTSELLGNTDMFSFDGDQMFTDDDDENDDYERLSEFDASDEHFLEASGILDSIHQVMKDFIVTATPLDKTTTRTTTDNNPIVISDDVIAAIRDGRVDLDVDVDDNDDDTDDNVAAAEARRLRQLRSLSDFNNSTLAASESPDQTLHRAKSARTILQEFGSGGLAKMSRPRRDLGTLVVEDTMTVVSCVLQSVDREEKMILLYPLLRLFGSHNRLSRLIRWAIEIEVASVINVATLFRSDDYASRLVSSYSKCVGLDFIRVVLAEPIRDILTLKIADFELNPDKHDSLRDEANIATNAANLMRACQGILDAILNSAHQIPSSYFHICSHLNAKVIRRFDGSCEGVGVEDPASLTRSVIGGFLFLRFVCPAITTPHLYNLTDKEPPPESRRVLVLLTKLLFKTATCVMFGEREPQFKILNPFIERNSPAIQQLFIDLSTSPEKDIDECFAADSRNIFSDVEPAQLENDSVVIRSITEKNLVEIAKKLSACGFPPQTTSEFKVAVLAPSVVGPRSGDAPLAFLDAQKLPKSSSKKLSVNKFLSFGKKNRKPPTTDG